MGYTWITTWLLTVYVTVMRVWSSDAQGLEGSLARCDTEGAEIYVPHISDDPCINCFCKDTVVTCTHERCEPTDGCHVILFEPQQQSCCKTCKGCTHNYTQYASNSYWTQQQDPCDVLYCHAGVVTRSRVICHVPCLHPVIVQGHCCPLCTGCSINGVRYGEGEDLPAPLDPCSTCICKNGTVECGRVACPVLNCPEPFVQLPPGKCCPVCTGSRELYTVPDGACYFRQQIFIEDDMTFPDSCTTCVCTLGTMICQRRVCPKMPCKAKNLEYTHGVCCPKCKKKMKKCKHRHRKYKHGAVWYPDVCTTCSCSDGTLHCQAQQCPPLDCPINQKPKPVQGACCLQCMPVDAVCAVFGDPHYRTFDGLIYNFQGHCSYVLSRDCNANTFSVVAHNDPRTTAHFSWTKSVVLTLPKVRVVLQQDLRIKVNHMKVLLPYKMKNVLTITGNGHAVTVTTNIGVKVIWDGNSYVEVVASPTYRRHLCGLCGNYNGDTEDELTGSDGEVHDDVVAFGESWRAGSKRPGCAAVITAQRSKGRNHGHRAAPPRSWLVIGGSTRSSAVIGANGAGGAEGCNGVLFEQATGHCDVLVSHHAYVTCRQVVDVHPYYQSCVSDVCACPREMRAHACACEAHNAYERACLREDLLTTDNSLRVCGKHNGT